MNYIFNLNLKEDNKEFLGSLLEKISLSFDLNLYNHSLNTLLYAEKLVAINKVSEETRFKIYTAAILHDYGKKYPEEVQEKIAMDNKKYLKVKKNDFKIKSILHGFAGAFIVKDEFNIEDDIILNAIKYHTVGRSKMNIVDKIIYIADKIEIGRDYEGVDYLREISLKNINLCLFEVYKNNILYIIKNNKEVYSQTFNIWNNICKLYGGLKNGSKR